MLPRRIPRFHGLKARALYLHEQYEQALECSLEAERSLEFCPGQLITFDARLYHGLAQLALAPRRSREREASVSRGLEGLRDEVRTRAENCPENFQCQHLLLEAEATRVLDRSSEAMELFERAIEAAEKSGSPCRNDLACARN